MRIHICNVCEGVFESHSELVDHEKFCNWQSESLWDDIKNSV